MVWEETQAQIGANEIGSLLYVYLKEYAQQPLVQHVVITTDSTVSQNRNQYVTCLLLLAAQTLPFQTIEMKFLETGHTQMEVDSMHSAIECYKKKIKVSSRVEWPVVLQLARRSNPYVVREMEQHEFFDLHELQII